MAELSDSIAGGHKIFLEVCGLALNKMLDQLIRKGLLWQLSKLLSPHRFDFASKQLSEMLDLRVDVGEGDKKALF